MSVVTVKISKKGLKVASVEKFVAGALKYEWAGSLAADLLEHFKVEATEASIWEMKKLIWKRAPYLPEGVNVTTSLYTPPESRADRLAEAESMVADAKDKVEELKGELDDWRSNLPEQFEDKGSEIDDAVSQLEDIENSLDEVEFNVDFPKAFGA